ncbi:MAG: T9SS C-terminal target domain-containing protein [Ignavibacteria bacterium]|nr:MAG: T9SS C-terminal target domain-containing protein [Ignavibacteria bacterium]
MKKILLLVFFFLGGFSIAQNASDYFPSSPGAVWFYQSNMLDSLNNPIDSLGFFQKDSFATTGQYHGSNANLILSAFSSLDFIYFSRYFDSSFYYINSNKIYEYAEISDVADSLLFFFLDSTFAQQLATLDGWYPFLDFSLNVNDEVVLFEKDFTTHYDTLEINVRVKGLTKRMPDESVTVPLDTYQAVKFRNRLRFYFLVQVLPPPLPPSEIPFLSMERNVWLAENFWIVKELAPSNYYDFSEFDGPSFYTPGVVRELIDNPFPISVKDETNYPKSFELSQNYPNPFNPVTTIKYSVPSESFVTLKVYDLLGNEISTLVSQRQSPGKYKVDFDGEKLSSGIYFYTMKSGNFIDTKKMILLK